MASVNKVIILGTLGRDPEAKETANGILVNMSLATSRRYKDSSGNLQEETEWHRVTLFGRIAEVARDYLKKGDSAYVEGRLKTRSFEDKNGVKKSYTEILAETIQLLPKRKETKETTGQSGSYSDDDPPF